MTETTLSRVLGRTSVRDPADPTKVAAVVAVEEASNSSKAGILARVVGFIDLLARLPTALTESGNLKVAMVESAAQVGGGITWGAPTAVPVTAGPVSTTLVIATAGRKAISIWNPIGNGQMSVDISGGAALLATGRPLLAGDSLDLSGAECPVGAITFIGTAGQSLVFQEGT